MTTNHALFFIWNGPREGKMAQAMESMTAFTSYWMRRKDAKEVAHFEQVMLASTGNPNMPVGFFLVTGERSKLQQLRWEDEEFLKLHTTLMTSFQGYACIDGYAGTGFEKHLQRLNSLLNS